MERWSIVRRRAAHDRRDECAVELEAIVARYGSRLIREAGAVERGVQPVATTVAGENPPRAVAAVSCRREPDHPQLRPRVAEAGKWPSPVVRFPEAAHLFPAHALAVCDQPRAETAGDDASLEGPKRQALSNTPHVAKNFPVSRIGAVNVSASPSATTPTTRMVPSADLRAERSGGLYASR